MGISANQVESALNRGGGGDSGGANTFLLLFMLLFSLGLTACLTVLLYAYLARDSFNGKIAVVAVAVVWVLSYFVGGAFKNTAGAADPFVEEAQRTQDSWFFRGYSNDMWLLGFATAILQFVFGNINICLNTLLGLEGPNPSVPALATPVLTLLANQPASTMDAGQIYESLRQAQVKVDQKDLHRTLQWLITNDWLRGSAQVGFGMNGARLSELA